MRGLDKAVRTFSIQFEDNLKGGNGEMAWTLAASADAARGGGSVGAGFVSERSVRKRDAARSRVSGQGVAQVTVALWPVQFPARRPTWTGSYLPRSSHTGIIAITRTRAGLPHLGNRQGT